MKLLGIEKWMISLALEIEKQFQKIIISNKTILLHSLAQWWENINNITGSYLFAFKKNIYDVNI